MSHNVGVFVDVSNLFYSAKSAGVEVNYCRLLDAAVAGRDLIRACAYTGVDPDNPNQRKFIDFLRANGYKVVSKDIHKYEGGRIKANLDIEIAVDILLLSENLDVVVLISGDGDFVRLLEAVQSKGVRCEVISFGISTSNELIDAADLFTEISALPGIFRNAPSGPGMHVRAVQQSGTSSDGRSMYSFSAVSYKSNYMDRPRAEGSHGGWEREHRPANVQTNQLAAPAQEHAHGNGFFDAHSDFSVPDADQCLDTHSVPLPQPVEARAEANGKHERE
jgi:uncharacterized LabA/DUF88 family protein